MAILFTTSSRVNVSLLLQLKSSEISAKNTLDVKSSSYELKRPGERVKSNWAAKACVVLLMEIKIFNNHNSGSKKLRLIMFYSMNCDY